MSPQLELDFLAWAVVPALSSASALSSLGTGTNLWQRQTYYCRFSPPPRASTSSAAISSASSSSSSEAAAANRAPPPADDGCSSLLSITLSKINPNFCRISRCPFVTKSDTSTFVIPSTPVTGRIPAIEGLRVYNLAAIARTQSLADQALTSSWATTERARAQVEREGEEGSEIKMAL